MAGDTERGARALHSDQLQRAARSARGGFLRSVGEAHQVLHVDRGSDLLLVWFEEAQAARARPGGLPWGEAQAARHGWSSLSVLADGRTWFRADALAALFDALTDEGFFDAYERTVFAGAGMGGYGAGAYSVAAPGALVFLVQPVATLDRSAAPWERRFRKGWALSFGPRYGYAPDMCGAASEVVVISDPAVPPDAMHASLFRGPHVRHLPAVDAGSDVWARLEGAGIDGAVLAAAVSGRLGRADFARLWRRRRDDPAWIAMMTRRLDRMDRPWLSALLAAHALRRGESPLMRRRLSLALAALRERGAAPPAGLEEALEPGRRGPAAASRAG